ncbi:helix-turn-helix domain-containing protein [Mitsuokella multacida]|uniref:Helix-turn-helix domain-containing protein n=1 Tax=Mitsuokella multacida TaxID=52226 RepID=A0A414NWE7_9FIRM|nr:helix-turn-helix domain-containing protein [Mitsuokella multacida]RHF51467.1 helix-turn-helix domain-containing protein [Mitsuokella multacida]
MSEKKASNRGSHGKYGAWIAPEGLLKIQGWARDGLSDKQIAHNIGITQTTLYEWQKRFPELSEALKKGKEVVDREVENAMLKRALGYEYDEVTQEPVIDKDTGITEMRVTKRVTKQIVPDVTAQIFWLKNRKPDEFRDKRDVELSGSVDLGSIIEKARGRVDE